jgi:diguanylate cyclase (GGDEF)-like protein
MTTTSRPTSERAANRRQVGLRIFVQFALSALLPICIIGVLSHFFVFDLVDEQRTERLSQNSEHYGLHLHKRLELIEARSRELAEIFLSVDDSASGQLSLPEEIDALIVLDEGGILRALGPIPEAIPSVTPPNSSMQSRLHVERAVGKPKSLYLVLAIRGAQQPILVDINEQRFWGDQSDLPHLTGVCVYDASGSLMHCSDPKYLNSLGSLNPSARASLGSVAERAAYEFGVWDLDVGTFLEGDVWTIASVQSRDVGVAASPVNRLLPFVALVSVLVAGLLAVGRIRRTLQPLGALLFGTRRLSQQDFNHRIEVASGDEFEELAAAFNSMAADLQGQFELLNLFREIDRALLAGAQPSAVIKLILGQRELMMCGDAAAILVFDNRRACEAKLFLRASSDPFLSEGAQVSLPGASVRTLDGPRIVTASDPLLETIFQGVGIKAAHIVPAMLGEQCLGMLAVGWHDVCEAPVEARREETDLALRLAIAIDRSQKDSKLYRHANYDSVTGLPNRHLLVDRLQQAVERGYHGDVRTALLLVDLKNFKLVNDASGHAVGDALLSEIGRRISRSVRDRDTVARIGGDEFAVLLPDVPAVHHAELLARKLIEDIKDDFVASGQTYSLDANVGIASAPLDGRTAEELLRNANIALNRSKSVKHARVTFYTEEMNGDAVDKARLENDLRSVVESNQLILHYQPQYSLEEGRIVAAEALVRWIHPELGLVPPDRFIPLSEENDMIHRIGAWVLREASREWRRWQVEGWPCRRIAVNVSTYQFRTAGFIEAIERELVRSGGNGDWLEIEVTESSLALDLDALIEALTKVRAMGVKVAIDDFGTGYSSLAYLRRFPFDILKVDRSFLEGVPQNPKATNLLESIVAMAQALGKQVVIEGVETVEQLTFLERYPALVVQGYLIGAPSDSSALLNLMRMPQPWHRDVVEA